VYRSAVVASRECRSIDWIVFRSTPWRSAKVAMLCLRSCGLIGAMPALAHTFAHSWLMLRGSSGVPCPVVKTRSGSLQIGAASRSLSCSARC
jgi:hypothetical protein